MMLRSALRLLFSVLALAMLAACATYDEPNAGLERRLIEDHRPQVLPPMT